uniref:IST1-like protein n=1 Tax=Aegilops tauschii subsp. strangulata TaxID=200361 RepID=A0A453NE86_AEGTS
MVKFLRKDVADLLTNNLESHAFGRMEGLIVEMNQASCYDMIEQYCDYIGKQLNNLQKQSECPHEALEAVSTLIFAAARYPDLPELCELRHVFTEKYGASIEPFVSSEFVQKLQNKSFTKEEKLQVIEDVAEEFAIPFNTKTFERQISGVPPNKKELLKKGSFNGVEVEASGRNGHRVDKHAVLDRKSKSIPDGREWKQEFQIKPKDIHVVPDYIGQVGEKSRKNYSDKPVEKKHLDSDVPPVNMKRRNGHQKEVNKDEKKGGQSWRELMNAEELDLNGSKKQEVAVEKANGKGYHRTHMAAGTDHNWGHADLGLKTLGLEKQETESAGTLNGNGKTVNKVPPYSKPYKATSEFGQPVQDRQQMPEKLVNMRPPYVKPNSSTKPAHENPTDQAAANGYKLSGSEPTGHRRDGLVDDDGAPRPVSVRRKSSRPPTHGSLYDEVTNDEKVTSQTPGGRTRRPSSRNGSQDDHERRKHSSRRNGSTSGSDYQTEEDETDTAIDFGNLLPRAPRKHRSRSAHPREGGGHDDEERMMDKLLRHYSKKGMEREEEHKTRSKSRTPRPRPDQPADGNNREGAPSHPERTVSLPAESGSPVARPKAPAPARSISLQQDTSRGNVHPKMPDFDELAARISALKRV